MAEQVVITKDEKQELVGLFEKLDLEKLKVVAEAISMFDRAFEGKSIDASDVITRLINIKNPMERSRYPTYPLLAKQVYLRLIAHYNPQAEACKRWADLESEALIAYKGQNWDAYVEMAKAQSAPQESQQFYFGKNEAPGLAPLEEKKHFWQRKKKPEASEFKNQ